MGLRWSMENIFGWRSHFDRVVRWHRRIRDSSMNHHSDRQSFVYDHQIPDPSSAFSSRSGGHEADMRLLRSQ